MDVQVIIAVAVTGVAGVAVVVTLCLAVLRGFRWLYDKIDGIAKELREDNATLAKEFREDNAALAKEFRKSTAENAVAISRLEGRISGLEGRMTVMETVLKAILQAVLPGSSDSAVSLSADTDAVKAGGSRLIRRSWDWRDSCRCGAERLAVSRAQPVWRRTSRANVSGMSAH